MIFAGRRRRRQCRRTAGHVLVSFHERWKARKGRGHLYAESSTLRVLHMDLEAPTFVKFHGPSPSIAGAWR